MPGQQRVPSITALGAAGMPFLNRAIAEYEFGTDSGVVGTVPMRGDTLPNGAIIVNAWLHVDTILTGATATVGVSSEGASDLQAATAISGAPWSTTGIKVPTKTATSAHIKTTAERTISAVIGTANLTAGRFRIVVEYLLLA